MDKKNGYSKHATNVVQFNSQKPIELYDLAIEQSLIGVVLVNNLQFENAASLITSDSFFAPIHSQIWLKIKEKIDNGQRATPTSLAPFFKDNPELDQVGGHSYLIDLAAGVMPTTDAEECAKVIRDFAARRSMLEAVEAAALSLKSNPSIYQSIQPLEIAIHRIAEVSDNKLPVPQDSWISTVKYIEGTRNGEIIVQKSKFHSIDKIIGGLQSGCVYVLAGATGMGKTALGMNIANNVAQDGSVLYFSIEMSHGQLLKRLAAAATGISVQKQNEATTLTDDEMRRLVTWKPNNNLRVVDTAFDINSISNFSKKFIRKFQDARLIVIDYLQLINGNSKLQKVHQIEEITKSLKQLALKINIPIILLSQLSRGVSGREDKRPIMSDLRDSGAIEQDADGIMFVYRPEYYLRRAEPTRKDGESTEKLNIRIAEWQAELDESRGKAEIIIDKNRYGETGTAHLKWDGARSQFSEPDFVQESFF